MRRHTRRAGSETPQSGEDSFLDIISNMVGIMIILVMVAGVRVGSVVDSPSTDTQPTPEAEIAPPESAAPTLLTAAEEARGPAEPTAAEKTRYVESIKEFVRLREEGEKLKTEVDRLNAEMLNVKNEAEGARAEYLELTGEIAAAEAAIEKAGREKSTTEQERLKREAQLRRLDSETERLRGEADRLAQARPKAKVLENMPTPLTKKVEGSEGVFALREGKISHVPIGYFAERVRGYFRTLHDFEKGTFEDQMGPYDGYLFRFRGSLHKVRTQDGRTMMNIVFDEGEFIPSAEIGETWDEALKADSLFRQKLALYLRPTSVITLSVYPDSFGLLREVKKFLLENDYTIAIRPMPSGKNIVISPNGTESTTY
ncbi:MAG: hypothetical protein J6S40_05570 [Thermoguttaceae bacterium]|nr:hypothetical protein [Thermoguttaceae bacterium]